MTNPTASFACEVLRPPDLLALGFRFFNLAPAGGAIGASLVRVQPDQPGYVVVDLAPQHIFEEAAIEEAGGPTAVTVPVRHRMAGPSRVALRMPDDVTSVPFTMDALLDWSAWTPSLVPVMVGTDDGQTPGIRKPTDIETSLELPYRLFLSPDVQSWWEHLSQPREISGRVELWHSRLAAPEPEGPTVRAVWSPDWPTPGAGADYPVQPLTPDDRRQLVGLTSDMDGLTDPQSGTAFAPVAVPVERLVLSTLGGWLSVHGMFYDDPHPAGYDLVDWKHVTGEGRDHYTKRVYTGHLYPFGFRAHLTTITERKIADSPGGPVAALLQRTFITVQQPFRDYTGAGYPFDGREMPLRTVTVNTATTPDLGDASLDPGLPESRKVILPDGTPVPFHLTGTDLAGNPVHLTVGMFWIDDTDLDQGRLSDPAVREFLAEAYADEAFARGEVGGQRMTFAPPPTAPAPGTHTTGDTSLHTAALRHAATWTADGEYLPALRNADVHVPAIEHLAGPSASPPTIALADAYLSYGLDDPASNASALYAQVLGTPIPAVIPAKLTGGLLNPTLEVTGLSAHLGPVAGTLSTLAAGVFDPADFFGPLSETKLFGAIGLDDLIADVFDLSQMPQTVTRAEPPTGVPTEVVTTLSYRPQLRDRSDLGFRADAGAALTIKSVLTTRLDGTPPSAVVSGSLTNFTFLLPPGGNDVIRVHFASMSFHADGGSKPDFSVELTSTDPVEFDGILSFLNELRRLIPFDGFSDPPALDVTEAGVVIGYSLGLPPLPLGMFQLSDVSLGAELTLPFTGGHPRLRFHFCEREHPCLLTVSMLGGGAFLALGVGLDGIELVEAAIDFGGSLAFDIGVASGGVSVLAGIYFRYDQTKQLTELDGFFKIHGSVEVLGLVTVSVEFDLSFGYTKKEVGYLIHGEATISVRVDLTLFSFSVSLHTEKSFGSAPGDPDFKALMPTQSDWDTYAEAFAAA
jgi:hypothetical protein